MSAGICSRGCDCGGCVDTVAGDCHCFTGGPYHHPDYSEIIAKGQSLIGVQMYARLPLCIDPGTHYFQLDHIKRDTAVCTKCGLIRKQMVDQQGSAAFT